MVDNTTSPSTWPHRKKVFQYHRVQSSDSFTSEQDRGRMADKASSSSTGTHSKKVLLFGKTGSGKSTVANALVTGGMEEVLFKSSDGASSCTRKIQVETRRGYTVVDTVGLGEAEVGSVGKNAGKEMLLSYLKIVKSEYSHIIYVIKNGRFTTMDEMLWVIFSEVFEGGEDGFVILLTSTDEKWLKENKDELPDCIRLPGYPILVTDIPPTRERPAVMESINKKIRSASIKKLEADLEDIFRKRQYRYVVPKIAKMNDEELEKQSVSILERIVKAMKRLFAREEWKTVMKGFSSLINIAGFAIGAVSMATQS